jgi:RNA recognition motif-containing protein
VDASLQLHVGNLAYSLTEKEIKQFLKKFGPIRFFISSLFILFYFF